MKIQTILENTDISYPYLPSEGREGHIYRGVTQDEFRSILKLGYIKSTRAFSHCSEGTCFAESPDSAQSIVTFGRDNPGRTGKPVYVLEVRKTDDIDIDKRDGYPKSKLKDGEPVPIPNSNITYVWKFNLDGTVSGGKFGGIQENKTILEKIHTGLTFNYKEDIENNSRGWRTDIVTAHEGDDEVGYIKVTYIPKDVFGKFYPTILNWFDVAKGHHVLPYQYRQTDWKKIPLDELKKNIASAYHNAHEGRSSHVWEKLKNMEETANDQQVMDFYDNLEKVIEKRHGEDFRDFKSYWIDKPMVQYIQSDRPKQGIGTALYRAAHDWLKRRGMKLYASDLQTKEAQAVWNSMAKKYKLGIENYKHQGKKLSRPYFEE
jgi:GNAT superfamily N-acetyltransferase